MTADEMHRAVNRQDAAIDLPPSVQAKAGVALQLDHRATPETFSGPA